MTYREMKRQQNIQTAEKYKNENPIEEIIREELYKLTVGGGRGTEHLLSLADLFHIADYVKENFPDRE